MRKIPSGNYQIGQGRNQTYDTSYGWCVKYLYCTGAGQGIQFVNTQRITSPNYCSFALTHCGNGYFTLKSNPCNAFLDKDLKFNAYNGIDDSAKFKFEICPEGGVKVRAKANGALLSTIPLYFDRIY